MTRNFKELRTFEMTVQNADDAADVMVWCRKTLTDPFDFRMRMLNPKKRNLEVKFMVTLSSDKDAAMFKLRWI